jgi:hypothetical protein
LACIDVSGEAIAAAQAGTVPEVVNIKDPKLQAVMPSTVLERATDPTGGVLLHCIKEGSHLRVRITSEGYEPTWNVQFPNELRQEGAKYWVAEVRESARGGFYRAYGDIKSI